MQKEDLHQKVIDIEKDAKSFGFYWEEIDELLSQIQSESKEIKEAWESGDKSHLEEEIGDIMLATVSLAIFCGLDPHKTLNGSIQKFQARYQSLLKLVKEEGLENLRNQPMNVLLNFWKRAKKENRVTKSEH